MSVNDDSVQSSSDSFWEIGKYSRTVKRCDNGYKLCDSLRQLIEQRSEIEKSYAKQLTQWTRKWHDYLDKGPEYGTSLGSWKSILFEADNLSTLHQNVADDLMFKVHASIKTWQKENYHKSMMHFKQTKEFEDSFKKAQKPWEKKLSKVILSKKDYHNACRSEKSTSNQENNARGDSAMSSDQLKKLQEKLRRCQQEVESTRDKYEASLTDLNGYNAKYMEDMTEVFSKTQDFERKRIDFFKKAMCDIHQCLDLSVVSEFSKIYTDLHSTISCTDANKDLRWWSGNHGVDMPMNWPQFEEFAPELQAIFKKEKKSQVVAGEGITITSIKHNQGGSYHSDTQGPAYTSQTSPSSVPPATDNHRMDSVTPEPQEMGNPFGDINDWEEEKPVERGGESVRALYDYSKAEDDELTFKAGDHLLKLSDEDELGWCRGRIDGKEGLYPANYVEAI